MCFDNRLQDREKFKLWQGTFQLLKEASLDVFALNYSHLIRWKSVTTRKLRFDNQGNSTILAWISVITSKASSICFIISGWWLWRRSFRQEIGTHIHPEHLCKHSTVNGRLWIQRWSVKRVGYKSIICFDDPSFPPFSCSTLFHLLLGYVLRMFKHNIRYTV